MATVRSPLKASYVNMPSPGACGKSPLPNCCGSPDTMGNASCVHSPQLVVEEVTVFSCERPMGKGDADSTVLVVEPMLDTSSATFCAPQKSENWQNEAGRTPRADVSTAPPCDKSPADRLVELEERIALRDEQLLATRSQLHEMQKNLSETSVNRDDRELECLELNKLVDALQKELMEVKAARVHMEELYAVKLQQAQNELQEALQRPACVAAHSVGDPCLLAAHTATLQPSTAGAFKETRDEAAECIELAFEDELVTPSSKSNTAAGCQTEPPTKDHDDVLAQLIAAKVRIAEYQAVLDRLHLAPPFADRMIGTAVVILRSMKAA